MSQNRAAVQAVVLTSHAGAAEGVNPGRPNQHTGCIHTAEKADVTRDFCGTGAPLVGGISSLALILLLSPLISRLIAKIRPGKPGEFAEEQPVD